MKAKLHIVLLLTFVSIGMLTAARADQQDATETKLPEFASPQIRYTRTIGLGPEKDVCRRDPSDVIKVGERYYVWYTKVRKGPGVWRYPSGYSGTVWYATSADGKEWSEQGEAIGTGRDGAWDEHGVFTPNILVAQGKYYLAFSGVPKHFSESTPHGEGMAVADSPDGPWQKTESSPVLVPSKKPGAFDTFRACDSCFMVRQGRYWLYYKGRSLNKGGKTPMHLAIAEQPTGPYRKHPSNPLILSGHEVLVWPHREGVAALVSPYQSPQGSTIQYAPDGLHFSVMARIPMPPMAPGGYRPDAFTDTRYGQGLCWGISMVHAEDPYLVRFECTLATSTRAKASLEPDAPVCDPFGCAPPFAKATEGRQGRLCSWFTVLLGPFRMQGNDH